MYHPEDSSNTSGKDPCGQQTPLQNTMEPLAIKHNGSEHTGDTINVVWESDHNVHLARERGQFYMYTANVKQTVQSVSVDVLGSTALVGQDVYAKPSLCQNPHSARDDSPCRDCCPDRHHTRCSLHTYK